MASLQKIVILCLGAVLLASCGDKKEQPKKKAAAVIEVVIPPPLPPPPPPPPPPKDEPPPEEVKQEMIEQEEIPEEAPPEPDTSSDEPAGDNGADLPPGDGPGNGFGAGGKSGGSGTGTGRRRAPAGKYDGAARMLIRSLTAELQRNSKTRTATFSAKVAVWVDSTGRVTRVKLSGSSGSSIADDAIRTDLIGYQLPESLPSDMPMPIHMRLSGRKAN